MTVELDTAALAATLEGPLLVPDEPGYDDEVAGFNTAVVLRPDLVIGATTVDDVVAAVGFAAANNLHLQVMSTGHHSEPMTDGLLLTTHRLDKLEIDPDRQLATVGGGVRWQAVVDAGAPHGLLPIAGSSTNVGVVGYLLGGGFGPLVRSHGVSSDYVVSFTVVTGEGDVLTVDADQHAELFWALRGGKEGLGIVTEAVVRLAPMTELYAGSLIYAEEDIETAFRHWVDWTSTADPQLSTSVAIMNLPPLEVIPPPLRGRRLLSLRFAYPGRVDAGEQLAETFRSVAPVYLDGLGPLPAAEIARVHNDPTQPGPSAVRGMALRSLDAEAAGKVLSLVGPGTSSPVLSLEIRQLGSAAVADVEGGSAVGGRDAGFLMGMVGNNPALLNTELPAEFQHIIDTLQPWAAAETNANFLGEPVLAADARAAWSPDVVQRIAAARRRYDPDQLLLPRSEA